MMSARAELVPSVVDRIKAALVGLRMPSALEIIDVIVRQLERGEISALEAIDVRLAEEFTLRESRRIKTSVMMARLSNIKTLSSFDFAFQPSLDRNRILALAELKFIVVSIKAARAATPRRLHRLPVHDDERRTGRQPCSSWCLSIHGPVQAHPNARSPPEPEVVMHCAPGRKAARQQPPLTPGPKQIDHAAKHASRAGGARAPARLCGWQ